MQSRTRNEKYTGREILSLKALTPDLLDLGKPAHIVLGILGNVAIQRQDDEAYTMSNLY